MNEVKKVLVVCDIVTGCDELAHYGAMLCRSTGAELFLLSIVYNPFGVRGLSFPRPSLVRDYRSLMEKTGKDLSRIARKEHQMGITVHSLLREGKPVTEIGFVIEEYGIDLLILPAQEQTRLESILSGGYNKTLLRKMPCSILYLKSEPRAVPEEEEQAAEGEEMEAA